MDLIDTELAWCAGFFDGEGNTTLDHNISVKVQIGQTEPTSLLRFKKAVNGLGNVIGPYDPKNGNKLFWKYNASSYEAAQQVLILMWPYLCEPKKLQAIEKFKVAHSVKKNRVGTTFCSRGHERILHQYKDNIGRNRCRACRREDGRKADAKRR